MVKPVPVYRSEIWAMSEMDIKRLGTWKREILRRIHGPVVEQGIWRIKCTQELWELKKNLGIAANMVRLNTCFIC